jgi:putative acetyltransferase
VNQINDTDVCIRRVESSDERTIRSVYEDAFGRSAEADMIAALTAAGVASLSLAAEHRGQIVGHVLFSPVTIEPVPARVVGLAPMAVLRRWQRRSIGSQLVRFALEELRRDGYDAVVVLGHPSYYPRFGFARASDYGLRWEYDCPDEAFMALELRPGGLARCSGVVRYRPELGPRRPAQ